MPILEVGIAHAEPSIASVAHRDRDHAIRIGQREAAQEDRADDGDQAGRRRDAERERQRSDQGETAVTPQQRERISDVLPQVIDPHPAHVASPPVGPRGHDVPRRAHTLSENGVKDP
jgi:hypothetical protein